MFDSNDKENVSTDAGSQKTLNSPFATVAESPLRQPLCEWNHSEVSPIARPEVSGISLRGLSSSRNSMKKSGLKGLPQETFASPLQCMTRWSPSLSMLPKYSTPPSQLKNFIVSNPFEKNLKDSLQWPVFSPSLFEKARTSKEDASDPFSWSIDEISALNPAPIEDDLLISQHIEVEFSPQTEFEAQQMIVSYFTTKHNVESPLQSESEKKRASVLPSFGDGSSDEGGDQAKPARTVGCQTALSLPPILPAEVEDVLRSYFLDNENLVTVEGEGSDDSYLDVSTCSLRRRLFQDIPDTHSLDFSPGGASSPIKCGTVLSSQAVRPVTMRSYGTPLPGSSQLMSPGFSPMIGSPGHSGAGPMRRLPRVKSKTRLDFSQDCMSVDLSFTSHNMSIELATNSPVKDGHHDITSLSTSHQISTSLPSGSNHNLFAFAKDSSMSGEESRFYTDVRHSPRPNQDTGFSPTPNQDTGFSPRPSQDTGFSPRPNQDTGFSPRPNQDTGFSFSSSSIFSSTRSNVHVEEHNRIQLLKGRSRNLFSDKRDESEWEPSSKHIVSSTPAKVSP